MEFDPEAWKQLEKELKRIRSQAGEYKLELPVGISDYVLYRENGEILAVVEAKKTSTDPRLAQAQTKFYVTEIEKQPNQSFRPFAFMTNGRNIYYWDVDRETREKSGGSFLGKTLRTSYIFAKTDYP